MQKLKFAPSEKALTLTLSRGRGDRFAANLKKQPAYWIWTLSAKCRLPFGGNGKPTPSSAGEGTSSLHTQKSSLHPVGESAGCFLNGGWHVGTVRMALRRHHIHIARHPLPVAQESQKPPGRCFAPRFIRATKRESSLHYICKPKPETRNPKSKTKCRLLSNRRPKAACTSFHWPDAFTAPYSPVRNESLRGCGWPRPPAPLWVRAPKFPARSKAHTT